MSDHSIIAEYVEGVAFEVRRLSEWMPCRRERIATVALQGLLASGRYYQRVSVAQEAVQYADALIAELDKPKDRGA